MTEIAQQGPHRFRAVAFDLLTALMNSWSLWIDVAGDDALGRAWRRNSLHRVTTTGAYRSYETIVYEATREVGLNPSKGDELISRWTGGELQPWPEAGNVLAQLAGNYPGP